ncbi:DMT family transporter [Frondihabitans cladoniiphilus]|uniref:EamA family transporter n=1 Tax=Frondihabitans cladoniiphilus TaxID=715785 RepID=A0ABP8WCH0_9MICO
MKRSRASRGLLIAVLSAFTFGMSGAFIKPLLEAGWSPAAAVTVRALIGGVVLLPVTIVSLRGNWAALWHARWRVLAMGLIGVSGTQLVYFAALTRIPVATAILLEYMAPLLLVAFVWARSRRMPQAVVLVGSVIALVGLVLVVGILGGEAHGSLDLLGLGFAGIAMVGCAVYYIIAAAPSDGLPPVALAGSGLVVGAVALALVSLTRVVPFTVSFSSVHLFGGLVSWWVPLLIVGVIATGAAYALSITASELLGSRLASFVGLLEVVAATLYAWLLLGERLDLPQLIGGALILVGIGFVRSEKEVAAVPVEAVPVDAVPVEAVPVEAGSSPADASTAPTRHDGRTLPVERRDRLDQGAL